MRTPSVRSPCSTATEKSSEVPSMSCWLMGAPQSSFQRPVWRIMRRTCACISRTLRVICQPSRCGRIPPGVMVAWTNFAVSFSRRGACSCSRPLKTSGLLPPGEVYPRTSDLRASTNPPSRPARSSTSPPPSTTFQSTHMGVRSTVPKKAWKLSGACGTCAIPSREICSKRRKLPFFDSMSATTASASGSTRVKKVPRRSTRSPKRARASSSRTKRAGNIPLSLAHR